MHKIETHMHTMYSSTCGKLDAQTLVCGYLEAGYSAVVVTDHYARGTFRAKGIDLLGGGDKLTPFLEGYYRLKELGDKQGLRVYKGAELRFDGSVNDYLLFGYPDELLEDPEAVFTQGLAAFISKSREAGALLVQAHPYRKGCTPADPACLDGVEILNLHPRHDNGNHNALLFARENGLLPLCGSDCHQSPDIARGGILTDVLPENESALVELLKSRSYSLLAAPEKF